MFLRTISLEDLFLTFFELERISAERSKQEKESSEDQFSAVSSDKHAVGTLFLRHRLPEPLPAESQSSCGMELRNRKPNWGGCSAGDNGLEYFVEVHLLRKLPDCVLVLLYLGL